MNYIDLTHTFTAQTLPYPGDPKPELRQIASIAQEGFCDYQVRTAMHVGTHMDAPAHMIEGGRKICDLPADRLFGTAHILDGRNVPVLGAALTHGHSIRPGDMVFIMTGMDEHYGSESYFRNFPELSESLAKELVRLKIAMLGLDTPSPDRKPYACHKLLLGNGITIVENMANLKAVFGQQPQVAVLPWKLEADAAPCRVVAMLDA